MACQLDFVPCHLKHILLRTHISETGFYFRLHLQKVEKTSSAGFFVISTYL
jgi:hypothetical protein